MVFPSVFPCLPETDSSLGVGRSFCQSVCIITSCCLSPQPALSVTPDWVTPGLGDRHEQFTALVPVDS